MDQQVWIKSGLNWLQVGLEKSSSIRAMFFIQYAKPSDLAMFKLNFFGKAELVSVATGLDEMWQGVKG